MTRPSISQGMRREVALRYGGRPGTRVSIRCAYCPADIVVDWTARKVRFVDLLGRSWPELDHVQPLYWGGPHTVDNLVPACLHCNRSKGPRRLAS